MQIASPNLTWTWSTVNRGNPFCGQKVKGQVMEHKNIVGVGHDTLVSADLF